MSYIPDLKKLNWTDLSVKHQAIRDDIEKYIKSSCCDRLSDGAPLMIKGAFGVGKTNALSYSFTYAWTELSVPAFFIDLNRIIELVDEKRIEKNVSTISCQMLISIIELEVGKLLADIKNGDWNVINGFSNNSNDIEPLNSFLGKVKQLQLDELSGNNTIQRQLKLFTQDVVHGAINSGNKALVIIDEFEDKYWKLKQRLDYAGGGPIRELFDYVVKSDSSFYLIIGNGPASGYELGEEEDRGGNTAQDRRLDVINVPSPNPLMLAKSFLAKDPIGYVNFIWWLSRSRPGLIQKARKQLGPVITLLDKDYVNVINENDIFSQQVDSQGETVKFLNDKFFEENATPLIKNTILKHVLFNINPQSFNIKEVRNDVNKCKRMFIGSKKLTSRHVILSNIENDLISSDSPNVKVSLKYFQELGRYKNAEWKTISFYLNTILEAISDIDGNIAFGVLDNNNWQEAFANSFFKPLLQMAYDFMVQFEDSGTKAIQEGCDYLLEVISVIDGTTKEGRLDISFPGLIYKEKDEDVKNFQAVNIVNVDDIYLQLSPFALREAFEQPIGEPKLNYKNALLEPMIESVSSTNILIRHFDKVKRSEVIFVPDLPEQLLKVYLKKLRAYIDKSRYDKYWKDGGLTVSIVYFRDNDAITALKKDVEFDSDQKVNLLSALRKTTVKKIEEFDLHFPRQMMVFIDSLCKIAIVGLSKNELPDCSDDKDESFISLSRIKDAVLQPTWTERKEVRRTVEHYSKVLFEGDKSAINSIVLTTVKDYEKELTNQFSTQTTFWKNIYDTNINDALFLPLAGIEGFTKRIISLFLLENKVLPKSLLDILKIAIEISRNDISNDKENVKINFFHFKQFIQSSGSFLKQHELFTLDNPFNNALLDFYSKLAEVEDNLESVSKAAEFLGIEKMYIDSYHEKLGGPYDSKIFSEALYIYGYFKNLKSEEVRIKAVKSLENLKATIATEITALTESLGEFAEQLELKTQFIKYDEDATKVINKVIVPLIEILNSNESYSVFILVNQIEFYVKRVERNVIKFREELDRVTKAIESSKAKLVTIQEKIDSSFEIPFNKRVFEINYLTKISAIQNFLKSITKKNEFDDLFGEDKKYSQAGVYKLDSDKVKQLISAITESFNDQESKAKKQLEELNVLMAEINDVNALESKIEQLLNTTLDA